jgi:hypothetical protein
MTNRIRMLATAAAAVAILATALPGQAADKHPAARTMITVHVNGHLGSGLAREVNELHAKMEAEGWRFAGLVPHTENGDTEGLWVTYVRD